MNLAYLAIIIPAIMGILQIIIIIYPKQSRKILTEVNKKVKKIFNYLFDAKQIVRLASIVFGALLIYFLFTGNTFSSISNQDISKVIGSYPICKDNICHFSVLSGNDIFFGSKIKYDSMISVKLKYTSDSNQKIKVGIGDGSIGYTEIEKDIERTYGNFKEIILINNEKDSVLCKNCFTGFWQKLSGSLSKDFFIKITPLEDIKIQYIIATSTGVFNMYRVLFFIIGVIYITIGFLSFKKNK